MVRIWAKIIKNEKILCDCIYEHLGMTDYSLFFDYVREICERLDCPTPVVLKSHIFSYAKYNTVKFVPSDFVEKVDFDKLVLENALL